MVTVTVTASKNRATDANFIARHMSHAIGDDQQRTEHVSTNVILTTLPKICTSEAKPNDRHLIGSRQQKHMNERFIEESMLLAVLAAQLGTPRGRYDEHSGKFPSIVKPRFNRPVRERNHF
jgi:hypothetical protein